MKTAILQWPRFSVPDDLIATGGKRVDLDGELWRVVLASTGQSARFC